jgi:P-type Ca2+ transporter type 2C
MAPASRSGSLTATAAPPAQSSSELSNGLTDEQVRTSRDLYGANVFSDLPRKTAWDLLRGAVRDPVLRLLMACAVLSIALGAYTDEFGEPVAIAVAVLLVTLVGTLNQLRAQRAYSALDAEAQRVKVRVVRRGRVDEIDSTELVVGDVVEVTTGDVVPADLRYGRGPDLLVSEAHITGEPDTTKTVGDPLYGSSRVLDGSGRAVVLMVGDATEFGRIRQGAIPRDKVTPLQGRLAGLARQIGRFGWLVAVATFVALMISGLARNEVDLGTNKEFIRYLADAIELAVTIVVVAVPEGLPLAVVVALASTTRRMARDQALVRELSACETMGAATVVCTDKTGTLTAGTMRLQQAEFLGSTWTAGELARVGGYPTTRDAFRHLAVSVAVNSTADLIERDGRTFVAGNSTEGAVLRWIAEQGVDYRAIRDRANITMRRDFTSERKTMLTAVRGPAAEMVVCLKGAPERVLARCTTALGPGGERCPLTTARREHVDRLVRQAAERGLRTLATATGYKSLDAGDDELDVDLCFDALFVIADPLRDEVPDAVDRCRRAGVRIVMITGDIKETATEIGRRCGIVDAEHDLVVDGEVFRVSPDDYVLARLPQLAVLARALPVDKQRLVELLQRQGEVVAVTGDGVNDAPALVTADVGFAMGSGSKVAREASDIVLVDDNFASLVRAIRWGRSVFENIRKFLQFQLTVNAVAVATAFVAAVGGYGTPLTAVQLLWVNIFMDSLAALALALEPPTDELFDQPPHGRTEPLISPTMSANILTMGIYMFVVLVLAITTDLLTNTPDDALRNTMVFHAFVWMQIFNWVNCRSVRFERSPFRGLLRSQGFLAVVALVIAAQTVIIERGGDVFRTVSLSPGQHLACVAMGLTVWPVAWLIRVLGRERVLQPQA